MHSTQNNCTTIIPVHSCSTCHFEVIFQRAMRSEVIHLVNN